MKRIVLILFLISLLFSVYGVNPVVTNVTGSQRTDGSKILDIYYDVACTEADSVWVKLYVSDDGGNTFNIFPDETLIIGDYFKVHTGNSKHLIWNAGEENRTFDGHNFQLKILASVNHPMPYGFIRVAGGTFTMGSTNYGPAHQVQLSSYYICRHEVTQAEWISVMNSNPSIISIGPNLPVLRVNWFDCVLYCNKLSINHDLDPCYSINGITNPDNWPTDWRSGNYLIFYSRIKNGYRLLTEAEWEFAALGGNYSHNYTYSGSENVDEIAWYQIGNPAIVETKLPNELGIYDMSGNMWEWCWDGYSPYSENNQIDPEGDNNNYIRSIRGGGFVNTPPYLQVKLRYQVDQTIQVYELGFRICRTDY